MPKWSPLAISVLTVLFNGVLAWLINKLSDDAFNPFFLTLTLVCILLIGVLSLWLSQIQQPQLTLGPTFKLALPKNRAVLIAAIIGLEVALLVGMWWWGRSLPMPTYDSPIIAVLPFENLDNTPDDYFSAGMTEDLTTQLSKIGGLTVLANAAVKPYAGSRDFKKIAQELGAAWVVTGSVRRAGNRVRIVSRLVQIQSDTQRWAENYDRELKDIFMIQSEVAQRIAQSLQVQLSPAESQQLAPSLTTNLTAYDYYLKGRDYYYNYNPTDNSQAIRLFEQALKVDPGYALAYAGLGDAYAQQAHRFRGGAASLEKAIQASQKAVALGPNLAEAHKALGLAYQSKGLIRPAAQAYERAIQLNPNYHPALGNYGGVLADLGRLDEAVTWSQRALALDPTNPISYDRLGIVYRLLTLDEQSERAYRRMFELAPDSTSAHLGLGYLYLEQQKIPQALAQFQAVLKKQPTQGEALTATGIIYLAQGNLAQAQVHLQAAAPQNSFAGAYLGYVYWQKGDQVQARAIFEQSLSRGRLALAQGTEDPQIPFVMAGIEAVLGRPAQALALLEQSIALGGRDYRRAQGDPMLQSLRSNPKFQQRLQQLKADVEAMALKFR